MERAATETSRLYFEPPKQLWLRTFKILAFPLALLLSLVHSASRARGRLSSSKHTCLKGHDIGTCFSACAQHRGTIEVDNGKSVRSTPSPAGQAERMQAVESRHALIDATRAAFLRQVECYYYDGWNWVWHYDGEDWVHTEARPAAVAHSRQAVQDGPSFRLALARHPTLAAGTAWRGGTHTTPTAAWTSTGFGMGAIPQRSRSGREQARSKRALLWPCFASAFTCARPRQAPRFRKVVPLPQGRTSAESHLPSCSCKRSRIESRSSCRPGPSLSGSGRRAVLRIAGCAIQHEPKKDELWDIVLGSRLGRATASKSIYIGDHVTKTQRKRRCSQLH